MDFFFRLIRLGIHSLASVSSVLANFLMLSLFLSLTVHPVRSGRSLFQNDRYYTCSFLICISGGSTFLPFPLLFRTVICEILSALPARCLSILLRRSDPPVVSLMIRTFLCRCRIQIPFRSLSFLCRTLILFLADPSYMLIVASRSPCDKCLGAGLLLYLCT